jgi:hypothetical protein
MSSGREQHHPQPDPPPPQALLCCWRYCSAIMRAVYRPFFLQQNPPGETNSCPASQKQQHFMGCQGGVVSQSQQPATRSHLRYLRINLISSYPRLGLLWFHFPSGVLQLTAILRVIAEKDLEGGDPSPMQLLSRHLRGGTEYCDENLARHLDPTTSRMTVSNITAIGTC